MTGASSRDRAPAAPATDPQPVPHPTGDVGKEHRVERVLEGCARDRPGQVGGPGPRALDERRYLDANPAACSLFGLPYEEVVSRRLDDFVPEEARPSLDAAWRDFLESGHQSGEFELVAADGSRRTVEFRATARVLPGCHLSVLRDITGRAAAEEAQRTKGLTTFSQGSSSTSTRACK